MIPMLSPRPWGEVIQKLRSPAWPQVVIADGLLTPEGLNALRVELSEGSAWQTRIGGLNLDRPRGEHATRLAIELSRALGELIEGLRITSHWAIASDNGPGLGTHSDNATITCNIWLTDDAHNQSPDTGGLVVYDVARPPKMAYAEFSSFARCRSYVDEHTDGRKLRIPYRCNRAIFFLSRLMHEVEPVSFVAHDILTRRLNLTYSWDKLEWSRARVLPPEQRDAESAK